MKLKVIFKKILVCILIVLMINNFFISNLSFATDDETNSWLDDILGTVVGILTWPIRLIALGVAIAVDALTAIVAYSQGSVDASGNINPTSIKLTITPFDILFNRVGLTDINFFKITNEKTMINNIRTTVATWYYIMRTIAAAILLVVLVYVGIRMAISTIATDKAMYKKMLVDWVTSLALIFLLQYIIIFTFYVNDAFIHGLSTLDDGKFSAAVSEMKGKSLGISAAAITATIVYCMVVAQTIALLFSYINRMLKIAFLIIIAPLITLTYSIDKMGDGKAQALDTWLKEFVFTVLLQPFHCIIYLAFVNMAFELMNGSGDSTNNSMAASVLAVLAIKFTKEAEKLLGKIFRFGEHTSGSSIAEGMAMGAGAIALSKKAGSGIKSTANTVKGTATRLKDGAHAIAISHAARSAMKADGGSKTNEDGSVKTLDDYKQDAQANYESKKAEKIEKKNSKRYKVDSTNNKYKEELQQRTAEILQSNPQLTQTQAAARARLQQAKHSREEGRLSGKGNIVGKARGTISRASARLKSSETLKFITQEAKNTASIGIGLAVGSMGYGSGMNISTAVGVGIAAGNVSNDLLKTSTSGMSLEDSKRVGALLGPGSHTALEAHTKMEDIMRKGNSDEFSQEALNDLIKEIENALLNNPNSGITTKSEAKHKASSLAKSIQLGALKSPTAPASRLADNVLAGMKIDTSNPDNAALQATLNSYAQTMQEKNVYDNVNKAANDLGMDPDAYVAQIVSQFPEIIDPHEKERLIKQADKIADKEIKKLDDRIMERKEQFKNGDINKDRAVADIKQANEELARKVKSEQERLDQQFKDLQSQLDQYRREIAENGEKESAERMEEFRLKAQALQTRSSNLTGTVRTEIDIGDENIKFEDGITQEVTKNNQKFSNNINQFLSNNNLQ